MCFGSVLAIQTQDELKEILSRDQTIALSFLRDATDLTPVSSSTVTRAPVLESWLNIWPSDVSYQLVPSAKAQLISSHFSCALLQLEIPFVTALKCRQYFHPLYSALNHFEHSNSSLFYPVWHGIKEGLSQTIHKASCLAAKQIPVDAHSISVARAFDKGVVSPLTTQLHNLVAQ